jgi:hypothetical protein
LMTYETNTPENSANNAAKPDRLNWLQQWRKRLATQQEEQERAQQDAKPNPKRTSGRTSF